MKRRANDGYVLVLALTMLVILGLMATTLTFTSLSTGRATGDERGRTQAFYASQSGLERTTRRVSELTPSLLVNPSAITKTQIDAIYQNLEITASGSVGTGTFSTSVQLQDGATLNKATFRITSVGKDQSANALRKLSTDVQVVLLNGGGGVYSPAALITTGDVKDNGAAPVAGWKDDPALSGPANRTFTCPTAIASGATASPCKSVQGGLNVYTLTTPISTSLIPPVSGQTYRDGSGRNYVVQKVVNNTTLNSSTVTLAAINENPTVANPSEPMNAALLLNPSIALTRQNVSSITAPSGSDLANPSNNTSGVCNPLLYGCNTYSFPPSTLFQLIFGTTKDVFKERMSNLGSLYTGSSYTAGCGKTIMWITVSGNFNNSCASSLTSPKIMVIDASASNPANLQIRSDTTFHGLLYVITNGKVSLAGNSTFKGSVVSEAGIDADPDNNGLSSVVGNGDATCPTVPSGQGNSSKPAKICYNPGVMSILSNAAATQLSQYSASPLPVTWREYAQ